MNLFIGITAVLTLLVVAWMVYPLLRKPKGEGISSDKLNAAIHRDQLHALETDLARGIISKQDFETTREELQLRLLDDTESFDATPTHHSIGFWSAKRTATVIGLSMPVLALGLYLQLGTPAAIDRIATASNSNNPHGGDEQVKQMVEALVIKLKNNPDNPSGWAMLARSYKAMGRYDEAQQAFEKAGTFVSGNPDILIDHAELLGILAGNNLTGKPQQMIDAALRMNPEHPMGLMMAGVASYQTGDFKGAVTRWEKLLGLIQPGSSDAEQVQANIADAREKAGMPVAASNMLPPVPADAAAGMTPEKINQMVDRLAARLKENPDDPAGWARLARAYRVQGRLDEAAGAYAKTGKLLDTDPDLLTQYADTLAMKASNLQGKPTELVNKALAIAPKHPMALMLAGQSAYQAGKYAVAIGHWEAVLTVLPANSPDAATINAEIADAKLKMAGTK